MSSYTAHDVKLWLTGLYAANPTQAKDLATELLDLERSMELVSRANRALMIEYKAANPDDKADWPDTGKVASWAAGMMRRVSSTQDLNDVLTLRVRQLERRVAELETGGGP